ncbi:MAG: protein translocase subunit SecF [Gammaproteobacteria bacterium]|nr:protein translocase subunit SecF [Gammaproteobacteria bacterium]MXY29956.1 protein translocase subunit SecF [Gammaproteobacteria bacterium]MYD00543.1 protein translocase subunit SecF [Gammaproteobacteria bacterium]MYF62056.1 protein translocase subunit SecF [Gammaproteobacteria bacterium]
MRLFGNARYRFIEARRKAYVFSALVLAVALASMVVNIVAIGSWQNYGVDFTGGSLVQVRFDETMDAAELRSALGGAQAPPITSIGNEGNEFVIRAPLAEDREVEAVALEIRGQIQGAFPNSDIEVVRTELVGPKIGAELQQKAALAILFSFALTLIYLAIRFEFRFGVAAVIATVHDSLITLGFLALFRVEIALPTVAAILTIIGYSLNDTIVVFDRVRENLNAKGGRREDPVALVNRSINETLPRTVLTSGTTLGVLMALLIFGGAVIRDFTTVLILGVLVGTYSSIFVASPALLEIQRRWGTKDLVEAQRGGPRGPVSGTPPSRRPRKKKRGRKGRRVAGARA